MFSLSKRLALGLLAFVVTVAAPLASQEPGKGQGVNRNIKFGMPAEATADPKNRDNYLISRDQYVLSYNDKTKTPNWVCWHLTAKDIGHIPRGPFQPDPDLPPGFEKVTPKTYS